MEGAISPPAGVTPNFENPEDVLATVNLVVVCLVISLMAFFVSLRLYIRRFVTRTIQNEDWVCLIAWLLATGYCMTGIFMGAHGGGRHEWEVEHEEIMGFQQALYANTIVYGPAAFTVKVTILLMFIRFFSPFRSIVIAIYVFMGFMLLYYLPVMITKTLVCTPIAGFWDARIKATCLDQHVIFKTDTIMSATTDFAILIIPIPLTWSLNTTLKNKCRIMAILGLGGVATLASIVRMVIVFQPNSFEDVTVKFIRFNLLAVAEVGIGMVCACLPSITSLVALWTNKRKVQESRESEEVTIGRIRLHLAGSHSTTWSGSTTDVLAGNGEDRKGPTVCTRESSAATLQDFSHLEDITMDAQNRNNRTASLGTHDNKDIGGMV